jgi:RND family efflux transporter MFP subunit
MKRAPFVLGLIALVFLGIFAAGYLPRTARAKQLNTASESVIHDEPEVSAIVVQTAKADSSLLLPGNVQAITDTGIYARADGYVKERLADIGDRVKEGQVLAVLESPEVDQQLRQARANLLQAQAALGQSNAALEQAKANLDLAEVTTKRWKTLVDKGVLAKQDGDEKSSAYLARKADVSAAEANVRTAQAAIASNEANVQRLVEMQQFQKVRAPYTGIVTARNISVGVLVSSGSSAFTAELFRMNQIDHLRIFVSVPQSEVAAIHVGQPCNLQVQELGDRPFPATVTRTANSLDAASRTMRTEVQLANPEGILLPGMYAQVLFRIHRDKPTVSIPGNALVVSEAGTQVAFLEDGHIVRFRKIRLGRDSGSQLEVLAGLQAGDHIVTNPSDEVREGRSVKVLLEK